MTELFGRLVIRVDKAEDLPHSDTTLWGGDGESDPYCVIKLDDEELARTTVFTDNSNPIWNERNEEFFVDLQGVGEEIVFEIWDEDAMRKDDLLGIVRVPLSSVEKTTKRSGDSFHTTVVELESADGSPAGNFSYSLSFRPFGGGFDLETVGQKKSLHVGINYVDCEVGKGGLTGCQHDAETLRDFVVNKYGFPEENTRILLDREGSEMPTRRNIENAIRWLVKGAAPGDSLLFQYAGHGGQVKDKNGDEVDGMDETICPYDHKKNGPITDDDLYRLLVEPLPAGVTLTAVMDCCHSGTSMDLAYTHYVGMEGQDESLSFNGFILNKPAKAPEVVEEESADVGPLSKIPRPIPHVKGRPRRVRRRPAEKPHRVVSHSAKSYDNTTDANVVMLSGCMDDQTSMDAHFNGESIGAMTYSFRRTLETTKGRCSYRELLSTMTEILKSEKFKQVPQLSTARPFDLDTGFVL